MPSVPAFAPAVPLQRPPLRPRLRLRLRLRLPSPQRPVPLSARTWPRCVLRGGTPPGPAQPAPRRRLDSNLSTADVDVGGGDRLRRVRARVFCTMLLSYATYYICRSTFVFAAPAMQTALGLSITDVGIITSAFPAVYGVAKLFGGVIADVNSPRVVLAAGLMAVALVNAAFALGTGSVAYFACLWAILGLVSSVGFPACAKLLSTWYSAAERGRAWGTLNISLNIGGLVSPVLIGGLASSMGWRYGIAVPAALAAAASVGTFFSVVDSPVAAGLRKSTPAEAAAEKEAAHATLIDEADRPAGLLGRLSGAIAAFRRQLLQGVLTVPSVWLLAFAYFFVYIIRQGLTSWTMFYLVSKGTSIGEAALRVSGLELGGLLGSVSSGWLSDALIQSRPHAGVVGCRVRVALLYLLGSAAAIAAFYACPVTPNLLALQWAIFASVGFFLYGPQLLVGLSGAELVAPTCAGTSNGFLGMLAYLGAALAGLPLSIVVRRLGYNAFFAVLLACCAATAGLILPLLSARSFEQDKPA